MILDSINRKIIVPMVEKTAEIISYFKLGKELIGVNDRAKQVLLKLMMILEIPIIFTAMAIEKQLLKGN